MTLEGAIVRQIFGTLYKRLNEKVQHLASDECLKTAQNVAACVAGFVVPILWFGMNFPGDREQRGCRITSAATISRSLSSPTLHAR
jgi:hypothetical protein